MIAYDLKCRTLGHQFEGWFASSDAYRDQLAKGWITCPHCGSIDIEKLLSAPHVGAKSNQSPITAPGSPDSQPVPAAPSPTMSAPPSLPSAIQEMLAHVAHVQAEALKSSHWVGDAFAEEVRAQHYGETDARPVHGEATAKQAQELAEEGIAVMPILFPTAPPDKRN